MGEIITHDLIEGRSETGRRLLKDRMYRLHKKRYSTAYFIWLLLGLVGGHRMYLGYWKSGIAIALFVFIGLPMMLFITGYIGVFEGMEIVSLGVLILILFILIYEPIMIHFNLKKANAKLDHQLEEEANLI